MAFVVVLVVAVAVVVLVLRAAETGGRAPKRPRPQRAGRPLAPDDPPGFLRGRAHRPPRHAGSPA